MVASSPEELDDLLEDAALLGDRQALTDLLDEDAVIVGRSWVGGTDLALDALDGHVADSLRTHLVGGLAVTVGSRVVVVSQRARHGWTGVVAVRRTD